ncbi:unnamed protein product [Durusdinium trenchii]|uniref:Uncharacterized protein n=1 Tax=Durusdinium trenchii TaxID=1381693 RepID=A0ABP0S197_9DINO
MLPDAWPADACVLLLLVARGLEDVALGVVEETLEALRRPEDVEHLHSENCLETPSRCPRKAECDVVLPPLERSRWSVLSVQAAPAFCPAPVGEEGEAFVGKVLLDLHGFSSRQRQQLLRFLQRLGLFQGILAFLLSATVDLQGQRLGRGGETSFHGCLREIEDAVRSAAPRWAAARTLHREFRCGRVGARESMSCRSTTPFRASCVRDGRHRGFRSQDVMAAMGAGALEANADLQIDAGPQRGAMNIQVVEIRGMWRVP